jgi:hypothetical protein
MDPKRLRLTAMITHPDEIEALVVLAGPVRQIVTKLSYVGAAIINHLYVLWLHGVVRRFTPGEIVILDVEESERRFVDRVHTVAVVHTDYHGTAQHLADAVVQLAGRGARRIAFDARSCINVEGIACCLDALARTEADVETVLLLCRQEDIQPALEAFGGFAAARARESLGGSEAASAA